MHECFVNKKMKLNLENISQKDGAQRLQKEMPVTRKDHFTFSDVIDEAGIREYNTDSLGIE